MVLGVDTEEFEELWVIEDDVRVCYSILMTLRHEGINYALLARLDGDESSPTTRQPYVCSFTLNSHNEKLFGPVAEEVFERVLEKFADQWRKMGLEPKQEN